MCAATGAGEEKDRDTVVRLLLSKGASVNAKNRAGKTALKQANEEGNLSVVGIIKGAGATE